MKPMVFWLDFISPFAYLAFERLPQALEGCSYAVEYRPVLFGALLQHHAHKGPAEIEPKRAWTFRHVHWLAHEHGVPMDTPLRHPFNPIALLRLAVACGPNRRVCEAIFRHVWRGGEEAADPARLEALTRHLAPERPPQDAAVKAQLQAHGEQALARGLFGVPSFVVDDKVFWGFDALPMLAGYLRGDPWFDTGWDVPARVAQGIRR